MPKVLFITFLFQGHLQIPYAIGKELLFRDEKIEVIFIVDKVYDKIIKQKCSKFQTFIIDSKDGEETEEVHRSIGSSDAWMSEDNKERYKNGGIDFGSIIKALKTKQKAIIDAIHQIKPDLILVEYSFNLPFVMASGYPWAQLISTNPLKIGDQGASKHPPMGSGVLDDFKWYADVYKEKGLAHRLLLDEWYKEFGLVRKPSLCHVQPSPYFNVFLYPKMLNYFSLDELEGKWIQLNSTVIPDKVENFIKNKGWADENKAAGLELLTPSFMSLPGKLIYFSLGTVVSERLEIFKMFIPIFAKSKNKFVVSKGKFADEIELPENCVGAKNLNQLEFFKSGLLNLCVIHGGNNSFTEACHFGVPMVVCPSFGDQFDNAIKAEKNNLGKKVLLKDATSKLNAAIDFVLNSDAIQMKMKKISKEIQTDESMKELVDLIIEKYLKKDLK